MMKSHVPSVLEGFISGEATFTVDAVTAVPNADGSVAVTRAKGSSTSPGPDGKPVTTPFHSVEVVRKTSRIAAWPVASWSGDTTKLAVGS